jgi:non-specific serine/threonine protein kinase
MSLEQAMAYALDGTSVAARREISPEHPVVPLSRREFEVATLLARGLTNREIARELTITEGTAGVHVVHILNKLGLHSRWQVADWAMQHGLIPASSSIGSL